MGSGSREKFDNTIVEWIDSRLPIFTILHKEYGVFPTPKNFNYFWNFGAISLFMLVTMIVTGIILAMHYTANVHLAFDSVERIMRDVNGGWLLRYIHMNGASFFFIAVYIHIYRGMYYGSYKQPRELLWILGVLIFLLMMATAFMGYVLPWGQMSLWGATVITNLFSAIPLVGESITTWLWGGFSVDNPTLTRFFALHYLLPFVIFAVVFLHVWALHVTGSGNPLGIDTKGPQDTLPFHPYYTVKDSFGLLIFLMIYATFIFYMPDALGHPDNYIPADPLVTPPHIVPEWYFLPFYAILRGITFGVNPYIGLSILCAVAAVWPLYCSCTPLGKLKKGMIIPIALVGLVLFGLGFLSQYQTESGGTFISLPLDDLIVVNAKLLGVLAMFGSIALLFVLPWLDTHPIRSARFRPLFRVTFLVLFAAFVFLGYIGSQTADATLFGVPLSLIGLACTGYYYAWFLVILPLLSRYEKGRDLPASIHQAVLSAKSVKAVLLPLLVVLTCMGAGTASQASEGGAELPSISWSFNGPFGSYDRAALQRGYKIYREVCAGCHSMKRVYYRNLEDLGYDETQVKVIAGEYTVMDGPNDEGEMFERPARPSDAFKSPFLNDNQAKTANNGAVPPDLSLIVKARAGGANYIYGILTGYESAPHGHGLMAGQYWNKYKAGNVIAMAPPLSDGVVAYEDGAQQTLDQYARDVSQFLAWAGDPYMEERKKMGLTVLIFLAVFAGVMYSVKRKIWSQIH